MIENLFSLKSFIEFGCLDMQFNTKEMKAGIIISMSIHVICNRFDKRLQAIIFSEHFPFLINFSAIF